MLLRQLLEIGDRSQWPAPQHRGERQITVEVRKQGAAPGWFPFQGRTEFAGGDCDQHEAGLAGEIFLERSRDLRGGREMDEAITAVVRRAAENARALRRCPLVGPTDFVNGGVVDDPANRTSLRRKDGPAALASP